MRPKKRILLLCADEQLHSRLVVVLESKCYRVLRAQTAAQALAIMAGEVTNTLDLLLVECPIANLDGVLEAARGLHPEMCTLARSNQGDRPADLSPNVNVWLAHSAGMAQMIDLVRVLTSRKRGPKKAAAPVEYRWAGVA